MQGHIKSDGVDIYIHGAHCNLERQYSHTCAPHINYRKGRISIIWSPISYLARLCPCIQYMETKMSCLCLCDK
jgi:hypothetical protein